MEDRWAHNPEGRSSNLRSAMGTETLLASARLHVARPDTSTWFDARCGINGKPQAAS